MSGAMVTEYAAQVAAVATPSRSPQTSVRTPPAPAATSATPTNETKAATQKRARILSSRKTNAISAAKIGVVPRINAVVEALVSLIAYTYETWLRKIPKRAATASSGRSCRRTLSEPSYAYVKPANRSAAIP